MIRKTLPIFFLALAALAENELIIDLNTGVINDNRNPPVRNTTLTYSNPYVAVRLARLPGCPATPFAARVDVNLRPTVPTGTPPRSVIRLTVEHEGPQVGAPNLPSGWTTHIADDAQNDGFGGGSGLAGVAEAHVLDQNLAVWSTGIAAGVVERIVAQDLAPGEGAIHFKIADQYLSWGNPFNEVHSTAAKQLFTIPASGPAQLFIGLNRVVRDGSSRTGCGAKRAILTLE